MDLWLISYLRSPFILYAAKGLGSLAEVLSDGQAFLWIRGGLQLISGS